jgi:hypothetical protein
MIVNLDRRVRLHGNPSQCDRSLEAILASRSGSCTSTWSHQVYNGIFITHAHTSSVTQPCDQFWHIRNLYDY